MGATYSRPEQRQLRAGDHIYVYRTQYTNLFLYSHHGIYMGGNKVVHFTCAPKTKTSSSPFSSSVSRPAKKRCSACEKLEYRDRTSGVLVSCLDCFRANEVLHRYFYGVSPLVYGLTYACRLQGGVSNTAESDPVEEVLERAWSLLRSNGFGEYHLITNNCEDFATFCKTGQNCSRNGTAGGQFGQTSFLGAIYSSRPPNPAIDSDQYVPA